MKYVFALTAASLLLIVAGCGNSAKAENTLVARSKESVLGTEATFENQEQESVPEMKDITYSAVLAENPRIDDSTVFLSLTDVTSEDPAGLKEDLILSLADTQVNDIQSFLQKGTKVEFTVVGNAIMTFSIPPQIPGDFVLNIQLAEQHNESLN